MHEMIHMIKVGKRTISDSEKIGPFKVSRILLNAVGASYAQYLVSYEGTSLPRTYMSVSRRSHNYNLSLSLISQRYNSDSTFVDDVIGGVEARGRINHNNHGVFLSLINASPSRFFSYGGYLDTSLDLNSVGLGYGYKIFFTDELLSRYRHWYLDLEASLYVNQYEMKVKDIYVSVSDSVDTAGYGLGASLNFPMNGGWWVKLGFQYKYEKAEFEKLGVTLNNPSVTELGVGYGF